MSLSSVVGCAVATEPESEGVGELRFPLVINTGDGTQFRLSAQFIVTSNVSGAVQTVDGTPGNGMSVVVGLAPGGYSVEIVDGFALERSFGGQPFQAVPAMLASPKAVTVQIEPGGFSFVSYQFLIANDTPGSTLQISFGVVPRRGRLVGSLLVESASGVFAPYLQQPPPMFIAPYAITGEGSNSDPPTHDFFTGTVGFVVNQDGVGAIAALAPGMAGGNLRFSIQTKPDDGQQFALVFRSAMTAPFAQLTIQTDDLQPTVPVIGRIPDDPVLSEFRATIPFSLVGAVDQDAAIGHVDLQFQR